MVSKSPKEEVHKKILAYISDVYRQEKRFVSKREIRKKFKVGLYNYFKNVFDMYQQVDIEVPLEYGPREYARKKIMGYVQEEYGKGRFVGRLELDLHFNIHVYSYFKSMEDVIYCAGISKEEYNQSLRARSNPHHSEDKNKSNKEKIKEFIKENVSKGYYPSTIHIQKMLKLSFYRYYKDIYEAYRAAGVRYHRPCPIILGKKKEEVLTNIAVKIIEASGLKVSRVSIFEKERYNRGADITIINNHGKDILVEIKAYGKHKRVSKREIEQLQRYMIKEKINKGILITSSIVISSIPDNIELIDGNKLFSLIKKYNMGSYLEDFFWVQDARVNRKERVEAKERKRQEIIQFILENPQVKKVSDVEKALSVDLRTYLGRNRTKEIEKIRKKKK